MPHLAIDTLIAIVLAYLFGSISTAIVICKMMGFPDPRTQGSGNPGATNVLRFGGKKAAIITLIGDFLKGLLVVLAAKAYGFDEISLSCITFAVFIGHLYPIYFNFKGGKGVATAAGCLLALSWPVGVAVLVTWLSIAIVFRYSSLAAVCAAICAPVYTWYFTNWNYTYMVSAMAAFLLLRHHKNIRNLLSGKEDKIGKKKSVSPVV